MGGAIAARAAARDAVKSLVGLAVIDVVEGIRGYVLMMDARTYMGVTILVGVAISPNGCLQWV